MICLLLQLMTSYQENKQPNSLLSVDCRPIAVVVTFWSCGRTLRDYSSKQELIRRWDSERELLRSAPGS